MPDQATDAAAVELLDLHVHSTWSSGFCEAAELVRWASLADVRTLAITDHHQIEGYEEARPLAGRYGVELIPAIELDCQVDGKRVDLLGYFIDPTAPALTTFLKTWPGGARQFLDDELTLSALAASRGVAFDVKRLRAIADGRPPALIHFALYLVERGWGATLGDVYKGVGALLRQGGLPRGPRRYPPAEQAAAVLRSVGGVVSLAHPGLLRDDALVRRLATEGLVDAIEAPYLGYWTDGDAINARTAAIAQELGVPTSAGSDYHAYPFSPVQLGVDVPRGTLARLRAAEPTGSAPSP